MSDNVESATSSANADSIPTGAIIMWSGSPDHLPLGWWLCDGRRGTPDLRGRFVVGYDARNPEYDVGDTGGQDRVRLTEAELPPHAHAGKTGAAGEHLHAMEGTDTEGLARRRRTIPGDTTVKLGWGGGSNADKDNEHWRGHHFTDRVGSHAHDFTTAVAGEGAAHENRPPYYVLAFLIKA